MGWSDYKPDEGGVNPATWCTMTMRQIVHLSLRRLGQKPGPYPCVVFRTKAKEYEDIRDYDPPRLDRPRAENVERVKKGMTPEQVLAIVSAPDFNEADVWYYDIDANKPYTLEIHWGPKGVKEIKKTTPPGWQTDRWDDRVTH